MRQMLVLLVVAVVSARPESRLDVDPDSLQYQYNYDVNVPETGDQKSHTEERDEAGVVVGNFQVVDPNGDLRKLFYRVEGNSGFVITDQQVMVGFADPPPAPETYSNRGATEDGSQGGDDEGQQGLVSAGAAGVDQGFFSDPSSAGGFGQFGDEFANSPSGPGDAGAIGLSGINDFTSGNGDSRFLNEGNSSSGDSGSSSGGDSSNGGSSEGGSSKGGSSSSEGDSDRSKSGASGTGGQNSQTGSAQPITSQVSEEVKVKPFEFHGPAFTFSIQRTEPNRFEVKEKIIGHAVEFNTHGGRARRFAAHLH